MRGNKDDAISELFQRIKKASHYTTNEEELKVSTIREIENFLEKVGIEPLKFRSLEKGVEGISARRKDAVYGDIIIEFEAPDTLKRESHKKHALEQINGYLNDVIEQRGKEYRTNLLGVVFDGHLIIFVRWRKNYWYPEEYAFDDYQLGTLIRLLIGLRKKSLDAKTISRDFGLENSNTKAIIATLFKKFINSKGPKTQLLFKQWDMSFSYLYEGVFEKPGVIKDLKDVYGEKLHIPVTKEVTDKLFFVIYTYYALVVKLLIAELLSSIRGSIASSFIETLHQSKNIKENLKEMESGELFRGQHNIHNFIEADFFSWYLDEWDEEIETEVRKIIEEIKDYEILTFEFKHDEVRDLLKKLYQDIVPRRVRHDLGEFYTPDWLAEFTINESGYDGNPDLRVIDPACGSGTFPMLCIRKVYDFYLQHRDSLRGKENEILDKILNNIVGFDVNPVAVLASRANYLISITKFLRYKNPLESLTIPIYLTDSIAMPLRRYDIYETQEVYIIKTAIKGLEFKINKQLIKNSKELENYFSEIDENLRLSPYAFEAMFRKRYPKADEIITNSILTLFNEIHKLHLKNQDRIWLKLIGNRLAPIFVQSQKFDYVIGNPPWVNWEHVSKSYREQLIVINDSYGLYVSKGLESKEGFVSRDISSIFLYVCADLYLKDSGVLAFLIKPQYQNPAGEGFRKFTIKGKIPLEIKRIYDMTDLVIFVEAASKTSLIILKKGKETRYPIDYLKWEAEKVKTIQPDTQLNEIENLISVKKLIAQPAIPTDKLSSWAIFKKESEKRMKKLIGNFGYKIRRGIDFSFNSIYYLNILKKEVFKGRRYIQITNMILKSAKKKVSQISPIWVENELVFPILKEQHISKWGVSGYDYAIVPQTYPGEKNENELINKYPKIYGYLNRFKQELLTRVVLKKYFTKANPFYSIYDLGDFDSNYKIVFPRIGYRPEFTVVSKIDDKFLGTKSFVVDGTCMFIPMENEDEAHYICAILNSKVIREKIDSLSAKGKSGITATLLGEIKMFRYNRENTIHKDLSGLSKEAHSLFRKRDSIKTGIVEEKINKLVNKLYDISN